MGAGPQRLIASTEANCKNSIFPQQNRFGALATLSPTIPNIAAVSITPKVLGFDDETKAVFTTRVLAATILIFRFVALENAGKPSAGATMTINVTGTNAPSASNS